jgi:hypothetical protein
MKRLYIFGIGLLSFCGVLSLAGTSAGQAYQDYLIRPQSLTGAVEASRLVAQSSSSTAINSVEIARISEGITVLIKSQDSGSGVIFAKDGRTYYVLTCAHVVQYSDLPYTIVTPDKQEHKLDYDNVKKLPGVDLAVLTFRSDQTYQTARLADSDQAVVGSLTYVSGYPILSESIREQAFRFTGQGTIATRFSSSAANGYSLAYSNNTEAGMSGGPVLDSTGRLIAIHGQSEQASSQATGYNYGIPINTFISLTREVGINLQRLNVQIEGSTAIASSQPAPTPARLPRTEPRPQPTPSSQPEPSPEPSPQSASASPSRENTAVQTTASSNAAPSGSEQELGEAGDISSLGSQVVDNVHIKLDGATVVNTRGSFTTTFVVENRSSETFGFVPVFASVENQDGESVIAKITVDDGSSGMLQPGASVRGKIQVINHPWNGAGQQNLILVIKESTTGGRRFRISF